MSRTPKTITEYLKLNKDKIETRMGVGYVDQVLKRGVRGIRELTTIREIISPSGVSGDIQWRGPNPVETDSWPAVDGTAETDGLGGICGQERLEMLAELVTGDY